MAMSVRPISYVFYYTEIMETLRDEGPSRRKVLLEQVAQRVGLGEEDLLRTNLQGMSIFNSAVHWAEHVLVLADLLERPARGEVALTELGLQLLAAHPEGITDALVKSQKAYEEIRLSEEKETVVLEILEYLAEVQLGGVEEMRRICSEEPENSILFLHGGIRFLGTAISYLEREYLGKARSLKSATGLPKYPGRER